ncbi:MAG: substrate-binding domain-containing protein [Kiritimatiellae bacterium]|nr:substrate-binding domain-containing protein [Kiritimatiellia bacterium]
MDTVLLINASPKSLSLRLKFAGLKRYAKLRKWDVQTITSDDNASLSCVIDEFKPAGIIAECCSGVSQMPMDELHAAHLPIVLLDANPSECGDTPAVVHDQSGVAKFAIREFNAMKLKSVAYAGWFLPRFWSVEREKAFSTLAAESGMQYASFTPEMPDTASLAYERLVGDWLESLPDATGVFAANDQIASLVLAACRRRSISVPRELSVLGVDNDTIRCENESPALSSIQVDFENAGYMAGELLDSVMAEPHAAPVRRTFGTMGIIRRESTNSYPRSIPRITAAMELIRSKACEGIGAAEVASAMGTSRRLAEMRFREATGKSILEEIQRVRFERIFYLLSHTSKPIGAIADFAGYKSPESLRRLFQKRTGMSMREWRNEHSAPALRKRL